MSALALGLLLLAGTLHAAWNLLIKGSTNRLLFTWLAVLAGGLLYLPVLVAAPVPRAIWPFVVASGLVESLYYLMLAYAYDQADFSQAYPLARGAAPVLLAVWAALALREIPSAAGLAGLALVVLGLVPVGSGAAWWRWGGAAFKRRGVAAALGTALCVSCYSIIDGVAVRRTAAAPYTAAITLASVVPLVPWLLRRYGVRAIAAEARAGALRIVLAGALMMIAYTSVLRAYAVTPLAYAGAVREVGVVIAALAGWRWLGESFGPRRLAGAVAVFAGILVLAFAA